MTRPVTISGEYGTYYRYYYLNNRSDRIAVLTTRLEELIGERTDQPPQTYIIGVQRNAELLRTAAGTTDARERESLLEAVEGDLETRVIHLAAEPAGYQVQLSVVTQRDGRTVNGYRVGLVPYRWRGGTPNFLRSESSPARDSVDPGRYEFVFVHGTAETRLGPYRVGITGSPSESFFVTVP